MCDAPHPWVVNAAWVVSPPLSLSLLVGHPRTEGRILSSDGGAQLNLLARQCVVMNRSLPWSIRRRLALMKNDRFTRAPSPLRSRIAIEFSGLSLNLHLVSEFPLRLFGFLRVSSGFTGFFQVLTVITQVPSGTRVVGAAIDEEATRIGPRRLPIDWPWLTFHWIPLICRGRATRTRLCCPSKGVYWTGILDISLLFDLTRFYCCSRSTWRETWNENEKGCDFSGRITWNSIDLFLHFLVPLYFVGPSIVQI